MKQAKMTKDEEGIDDAIIIVGCVMALGSITQC